MSKDVHGPAPKRARVLIADDSAAIRSSLSSLIQRVPGVDIVGMACTGMEALDMVRILRPDVLTLDIRMPELNGLMVLEALRKEKSPPFVIVLTGLDDLEYRQKCLSLGANHFLHKSTEFEKAVEILTEHVNLLNNKQPHKSGPENAGTI